MRTIITTKHVNLCALFFLIFFAGSSYAAETVGALAPISIHKQIAYTTARPCAAGCLVYNGIWACGYNAGYHDLGFDLGCGCSPNNACFCSDGLKSSASSYVSSCVSARCKSFGDINSDVSSMMGMFDGYCATANVAPSTALPASTGAKPTANPSAQPSAGAPSAAPATTRPKSGDVTAAPTSTEAPPKSDEGLSKSDIIALGTGLGVGIPSLIIGVLALWFQVRKRKAAAAATMGTETEVKPTWNGFTPTGSQTHMLNTWNPPPATPAGPAELAPNQANAPVYELASGRRY